MAPRGRKIHHDVTLPERKFDFGEPVERGRELAQPAGDRHVEGCECLRSEAAGLFERVKRLLGLTSESSPTDYKSAARSSVPPTSKSYTNAELND